MTVVKIIATCSYFFLGIKKHDILDEFATNSNNLDQVGTLARLWSQGHPAIAFDAVVNSKTIVSVKQKGRPTSKYKSISQFVTNSKVGL